MEKETRMLLLVFVVSLVTYFAFLFGYGWNAFLAFLTSFAAGVLGILLGFALDRAMEKQKDNEVRRAFLALIHDELTEIKGKIPPQTTGVYMLYPEVWDSLVASGIIRLLSSEQVTKLTKVYRNVKGTQYEAEWVRRAVEEFNNVPESENQKREWLKNRYNELWNRHLERGNELTKEIENLLKEKWWKSEKVQK